MPMKYTCCFLLAAMLAFGTALGSDTWPQFRGPTFNGISDAKNLPLTWDETHNVKWKTEIHGKGWSSPVVWGNQVWMTTATPDGHELYAVCVDKDSGRIVYDLKLFDIAHPQYCIPFNSYASPTPCIEEGRVYVTFGSPGTACLDTHTGKVLWTRTDFVCNHYRGAGSSPLLYKNMLIMNFDGSDHQFVVALDKQTGKTLWRTERDVDYADLKPDGTPIGDGDFRKAFSTPRICNVEGQDRLISLGSKAIYAYDPFTGRELGRLEIKTSFSGSDTPVCADHMIFYGTGHGGTELVAVRPEEPDVLRPSYIIWRSHKHVPTRSSVLVVAGLLYMTTDAGIATCVDTKTGKEVWHGRIDGDYSASPIYADGRVYFFSEQGVTTVLKPGREFKILAQNPLPDGFMATPAVVGDAMFLRTRTHLYRVGN
ncbi:MAG TPA: PQQ-binding-like beta-propeller repeat protein [Tepidisphaeraceae bacterium]|nr:PQQ-binding-like beta-propeller repeat protein [Tepidisphaeraceae bacterium]